jgi:hypothetical protein
MQVRLYLERLQHGSIEPLGGLLVGGPDQYVVEHRVDAAPEVGVAGT